MPAGLGIGEPLDDCGRHHPYELLDYDGEPVEIDTEIVPLMRLLWEHDFDTSLSCHADTEAAGRVWVEFWGPSAEQFVQLVGRANPALAARMLPCEDSYDGGWRYSTLPHRMGDGELAFTISVFFPRSDLDAVVAALERAPTTTM